MTDSLPQNHLLNLIAQSKTKFSATLNDNTKYIPTDKLVTSNASFNYRPERERSPHLATAENDFATNYVSQRKLEQHHEEIKDFSKQLLKIDEKVSIQQKVQHEMQEQYARFLRENDFKVKKTDDDMQSITEKTYDLQSKMGVSDQKIKNVEEHIKITRHETESKFNSLNKQQQEYNKKLAAMCEKIQLVIDNGNIFGNNPNDNNETLKVNFDAKLQYYLEEMKAKYKVFSESMVSQQAVRDDEVTRLKEQMIIMTNIEEDFVRTIGYLKDLSD